MYENRIRMLSLLYVAPSLMSVVVLILLENWAWEYKAALITVLVIGSLVLEAMLHDAVIRPLQTLANVISSLRKEDYSFRARGEDPNDALGELAHEVNALAEILSVQRTNALEATELLKRIVEEIDSPLFTFDPHDKLRLVNSAGERLLQRSAAQMLGCTADGIGLQPYLLTEEDDAARRSPFNPNSRWLVRRRSFRQHGVPHTLIVLSDVSRALRQEERSAWQRLIRVLGHELNNSLTPIQSIAGTLARKLNSSAVNDRERGDFEKGLSIIESRAASLNRFLQAYRQLAQMPQPRLQAIGVRSIVERVAPLESRVPVRIEGGPDITVEADPDQFEQLLINLVRNGAEAALNAVELRSDERPFQPEPPGVCILWSVQGSTLTLQVVDNGPGLLNAENAFVPFYTTKAGGSGIGLVLCRQIIEAHGGNIQLLNRTGKSGCIAQLSMPIADTLTSARGNPSALLQA